jgi:hypothetical protein
MSQAQIKELENLLITMEKAGAPANEMRFVLAELDSLVETPETPATRKPRGRGEIAQAKKQEAIDNVSKQARVDPMGTLGAISQGVNKGIFNLLDLPGDVVNLAIDSVNSVAGGTYIPPQMNVTDAADLATKWLTGTPVVTAAKAPIAEIDTAFERILNKGAEYATEGAVSAAALGPRLAQAGATMITTRPAASTVAVETALGASAGTGAGVAREIAPESAAGELVGALAGGLTPSAANKLKEVVVKQAEDAYLPLTEAGVYRRIGETLQEVAADPETVISNIERNRLILEDAGVDPSTVTTAQLVEDPSLSATLKALSSDYNAVNNAIARGRADNTQLIVNNLKKEIPKSKTGVDVVTSANKYVTSAVNDLNDQIDLARNELDRLQGEGRDFATDEESLKFVAATQEAYDAAKKIENEMWSAVGKKEPLNLQPLKTAITKLERAARKEAIPDAQVPSGIYKQKAKMGTKKVDGKTVQLRNDFGFLSGYRSSVLQDMRAARAAGESNKLRLLSEVEKEISKFIDKAGSKDAYRAASAYTRAIRDNFNKGTIGRLLQVNVDQEAKLAEAALETIVKKGGKGAAEAKRVQRLATGRTLAEVELPAAPATAEITMEALRDKFYGTPRKESFFKSYGPMLMQFPGLSTELRTVADAIETVAQDIASKEGRVASLTDKNKTSVAALLNADPENIYPVVSGMTRDDIRRLNQVATVDGVEQGLQAVVLDEFLTKLRTRTASDWAEGFKSLDFVRETDLGFKKLFEEVLTPAQQVSLRRLDKIAEISFKDPTKGFTDKEAAELAASPLMEGLASMLALNMTSKFTSGAGALAVANRSSKAARDVLNKLTRTQSQRLIEQALLNPDVLIGLLRIQTKAKTPEAAANQVRAYLLTAGVDVGQEAEKAPEVTQEPVMRNVPMGGQGSRQQRQAGMLTGQ